MDGARKFQLCVGWSAVTASLIAIFWTIWYLATGEVPVVSSIKMTEEWTYVLPVKMSRWWDILIGPIWATVAILVLSSRKNLDDKFVLDMVFGLICGLVSGLVFNVRFGLAFSLTFGLASSMVPVMINVTIPPSDYAPVIIAAFILAFGLAISLVCGLAALGLALSLVCGLAALGLALCLVYGLAHGLAALCSGRKSGIG